MKEFLGEDFLLNTKTASTLFNKYSKDMPIFDYHCHLVPEDIAKNARFTTITKAWLDGDHYKWRQMRTNGIDEKLITGDGDDFDKFYAWAATMEKLIGNPLYHWTHLELRRYFGITDVLNTKNARKIYDRANEILKNDPDFSVWGIMKRFKVYAVGTTDDPTDDLKFHTQIREENKCPAKIIPSFRPDKFTNIEYDTFTVFLEKLEKITSTKIKSAKDIVDGLSSRLDFFIQNGAKSSDHGINDAPPSLFATESEATEILKKRLYNEKLNEKEIEMWHGYLLLHLAKLYNKHNMVMQLHINSLRNNSTRKFKQFGPDTGFDSCNDTLIAKSTVAFLDELDKTNELPKTILYSLNPNDFYSLGTIMGSFQDGNENKMQLGSGWWYIDHIDGMTQQMKTLANLGQITQFVGMLTDSRSFLSYPRHEYFRRIMCNIIGDWVENGEIPNDMEYLSQVVKDISFNNIKKFLND
ncbi:MAG: glucuronate isomerase [Spirochaetaceae bacterium]|nr:glucuronate isomerase [Spirochaetaceae bacterium]